MQGVPQRTRLARALLDGDRTAARSIVAHQLVHAGIDEAIDGIVAGAMRDIGERWECGDISVADEHVATATVQEVLALLRDSIRAVAPAAGRVVLCTPEGERHELALSLLGLRLEHRGWTVRHVGCDLPASSVRDLARAWGADACAISVGMVGNADAATRLAGMLTAVGIRAIVGDRGVGDAATQSALATFGIGASGDNGKVGFSRFI